MDRRESLKNMLLGGVGASLLFTSCMSDKEVPIEAGDVLEENEGYGRTTSEELRDEALKSETFFSENEIKTITILSDIIIPEDQTSVSASEAGVPEFIEFIVKDIEEHQIPMRGGLAWLNHECNKLYNAPFNDLSLDNRIEIIDKIAYPKEFEKNSPGPVFFSRIKDLVVTGYFTSEPGLKYLGYMGNQPNVWDGVPAHVLEKHEMAYDKDFLKVALDPLTRNEVMDWDQYNV